MASYVVLLPTLFLLIHATISQQFQIPSQTSSRASSVTVEDIGFISGALNSPGPYSVNEIIKGWGKGTGKGSDQGSGKESGRRARKVSRKGWVKGKEKAWSKGKGKVTGKWPGNGRGKDRGKGWGKGSGKGNCKTNCDKKLKARQLVPTEEMGNNLGRVGSETTTFKEKCLKCCQATRSVVGPFAEKCNSCHLSDTKTVPMIDRCSLGKTLGYVKAPEICFYIRCSYMLQDRGRCFCLPDFKKRDR